MVPETTPPPGGISDSGAMNPISRVSPTENPDSAADDLRTTDGYEPPEFPRNPDTEVPFRSVYEQLPPKQEFEAEADALEAIAPIAVEGGIIGRDDRLKVNDLLQFPYSTICAIRMSAPWGNNLAGTGILVSRRLVLTVAHNLYNPTIVTGNPDQNWARTVTVYVGLNGFGYKHAVTSKHYLIVKEWQRPVSHLFDNSDFDFGLVVLPQDQPLGQVVGFLPCERHTDQELENLVVNMVGYPIDCPPRKFGKESACTLPRASTMWQSAGNVIDPLPWKFRHNLDIWRGNSGGPLLTYHPNQSKPFRIVGIQSYAGISETQGNFATRINEPIHEQLKIWIAKFS